jgi:hypothetical protein
MHENGARPPGPINDLEGPTPVAAAVADARRQAEAMDRTVAKFSADHLKALLADDEAVLVEHIDDPELTKGDRARLFRTIRARRPRQAHRRASSKKTAWRRIPVPSLWVIVKTLVVLGVLATALTPVLRNTAELAIVTAEFSTQWRLPNGDTERMDLEPGRVLLVRRWLHEIPVAVAWSEADNAYATAPIIRSAVEFPYFPYIR